MAIAETGSKLDAYSARICWNSKGWIVPSGDASKLEKGNEAGTTYVQDHGFGHEEWIFNFQWILDGWKYSFLQPVNRSWSKVTGKAVDIHLYSIGPQRAWYYVGDLSRCEVLTETQATEAAVAFRRLGWLRQMKAQVRAVGGDAHALSESMLFNVRFKPEDAEILDPKKPVGDGDALRRLRRYTLVGLVGKNAAVRRQWPHRTGTTELGKTGVVTRSATPAGTMDLAHATLQHELFVLLARDYGEHNVIKEENFVDIKVRMGAEVALLEVKTDARPMHAMREGIGQLLEYAFACKAQGEKVRSIIIVAPGEPSELDGRYIRYLGTECGLPFRYLCFRQGMKSVYVG